MNANRTPVEHTLGVDVVYFNEARGSFVLVQYKKMREEGSDGRKALSYRPDDSLDDELERMRRIDALCMEQSGEFRLLTTACWMKLCNPTRPRCYRVRRPVGLIIARSGADDLGTAARTSCCHPGRRTTGNHVGNGYDQSQQSIPTHHIAQRSR